MLDFMDLFVVRKAGSVCDTDEIGSIAYGLAHVNTPVLVILGHTHCGAVTAVSQAVGGHGHKLERNIPRLVDNIIPAVKRAMDQHKDVHGSAIVPFAIEENVWQGAEDLFNQRDVQCELRRACLAAGLEVRIPHDVRHADATILLMAGVSQAQVQKQLGPSSDLDDRGY